MKSYDPRAKLDEESEGMIALAANGLVFIHYAASNLIRVPPHLPCDSEVAYWLVVSALKRHDREAVRIFINGWSHYSPNRRPKKPVFRFVPGDHFHVLGEKFDTLEEAKHHLHINGYDFDRTIEDRVYPRVGD